MAEKKGFGGKQAKPFGAKDDKGDKGDKTAAKKTSKKGKK